MSSVKTKFNISFIWSTWETHSHGQYGLLFSHMLSVHPHFSNIAKQNKESNDHYCQDCGSGWVDHWWHLPCFSLAWMGADIEDPSVIRMGLQPIINVLHKETLEKYGLNAKNIQKWLIPRYAGTIRYSTLVLTLHKSLNYCYIRNFCFYGLSPKLYKNAIFTTFILDSHQKM